MEMVRVKDKYYALGADVIVFSRACQKGYNIKTKPGTMELMKFDIGRSAVGVGVAKALRQITVDGIKIVDLATLSATCIVDLRPSILGHVGHVYGDHNLICTLQPSKDYKEKAEATGAQADMAERLPLGSYVFENIRYASDLDQNGHDADVNEDKKSKSNGSSSPTETLNITSKAEEHMRHNSPCNTGATGVHMAINTINEQNITVGVKNLSSKNTNCKCKVHTVGWNIINAHTTNVNTINATTLENGESAEEQLRQRRFNTTAKLDQLHISTSGPKNLKEAMEKILIAMGHEIEKLRGEQMRTRGLGKSSLMNTIYQ
uniref:Leucine aminopeptidase 2, chloroplastic n=1 Tax=Tanacetum cinerariifolium TaxID=118510 RepID=A0A699GRP6_TANCI|nr:leucine aminopeptidase 2, chloroplastic [Tanacetum cinerariifolium]